MPKVSVIVPNYNHAPYLRQRIDSILNQTYQDFELILLDDCSTDNSFEVLESYRANPHVMHIVYNEHNSGSTFCQWDKGIELAKGEWIWIAESDDWADPKFLEIMLNAVSSYPNCGLVYCSSRLIDAAGNVTYSNDLSDSEQINVFDGLGFINQKLSLHNNIWNASMMMFRKSLYPNSEKRKFFENMRYCWDWLCYVMLSEQSDVLRVDKVLNNFRQHDGNVSRRAEKEGLSWLEGLEVLRYMLPILSHRNKVVFQWVKNICKSAKRNEFDKELMKNIVKKLRMTTFFGWLMYFPIMAYYKIKL